MNGVSPGGEFWKDSGQVDQIMRYRVSGSDPNAHFLSQFGMPYYTDAVTIHAPGTANNLRTLPPVRVGDWIYLYTNDEGGRGVHRWRITPADLR